MVWALGKSLAKVRKKLKAKFGSCVPCPRQEGHIGKAFSPVVYCCLRPYLEKLKSNWNQIWDKRNIKGTFRC